MPRLPLDLWIKISLPLLLSLLLGLQPWPAAQEQAFREARRLADSRAYLPAAERLVSLAQQLPWRSELWEQAGRLAVQAGDYAAAAGYLEQAAGLAALSPDGLTLLGDVHLRLGDDLQAVQDWQAALQAGAQPASGVYLRLAQAGRARGDYPAAIQALESLASLQPGQAAALYELGLLLAAARPEAALPYLEQAAGLDPARAEAARAVQNAIRAAAVQDEPAYTLLESGRALASLAEWRLAGEAFRQALRLRPEYAEAWAYLGHARSQLGQDSRADFERALQLDPSSVSANLFFAAYWRARARPEIGLVYLYAAARLEPDNPAMQIDIGAALAEMGSLAAAESHLRQATEIAPRDPPAWQALAQFSLRYNVRLRDLGLPAARQAVLLAPQDAAGLDLLAQVYLGLNDPLSARRLLQRAARANPGFAPARLHLGLAALLLGDPAAARRELLLARQLAPGSAAARQAERLLAGQAP